MAEQYDRVLFACAYFSDFLFEMDLPENFQPVCPTLLRRDTQVFSTSLETGKTLTSQNIRIP
jgi:hypothetical protein